MEETLFNREEILNGLDRRKKDWDLIIVGGGATGLGAALEAVSRGYQTLLLEQHDFAKGTSSRSTKLVHGGVRYLAQGNIPLVMEALRERGFLKRNAPHLVKTQGFVIPCYSWWCVPFYTIGLTLYDLMAGRLGIGRSLPLSRKRTMEALPSVKKKGLKGGVRYYDCQFDDSRMAINLAQTILEKGGIVVNYMAVSELLKDGGKVAGVLATDGETGKEYRLGARRVINATGVFVDRILQMDDPEAPELVRPSQGIHLVMDRRFLSGSDGLMIPRTSDGRVLFALPWHGEVVVGTTDVEKHEALLEPHAEEGEVQYILETAQRYLDPAPERGDVLSVFTGLRPLAAPSGEGRKTKEISRGHKIIVSKSGLVTIIGGKWTTYRIMGEDVVATAFREDRARLRGSVTRKLAVHGHCREVDLKDPWYWYGSDRETLMEMSQKNGSSALLSDRLSLLRAQVTWSVRYEMARTVEDFLARRSRALQLDARESIRIAPEVAALMARELGRDADWEKAQLEEYTALASTYLLSPNPQPPTPNP